MQIVDTNRDDIRPLPRNVALLKWGHFFDSRIGGASAKIERQMTGLVQAGATEESLKLFWREVKHLSWPGSWGQAPWDTASTLAAALEARDLGSVFNAVGFRYVEPFRGALREALANRDVAVGKVLPDDRDVAPPRVESTKKTLQDAMQPQRESLDDLLAEQQQKKLDREMLADQLMQSRREDDSIAFSKSDGRIAIAGPDASKVGSYRVTWLDKDGPSGHAEAPTLRDAIVRALYEGYQVASELEDGERAVVTNSQRMRM
jgi:hypothetical protein